jgi:exodeoxyribonuclease VII large subunit
MDNIQDNEIAALDVYNVTRLNREVRAVLEGSFPAVWVQGEISNLAQPASGHIYFSLKDQNSQVRCAMFQNRRRSLKFSPENGISVLIRANVSLYENRGEYQLIVEHMEAVGDGALQRAFEELKQRLFKEGLFDEQHKKPVPHLASTIGIITSPTGAAIRDILTVLGRRYPLANIILYPTPVQGENAPAQIISMLQKAERRQECDVLILSRGGGSLEDLWAFNNESLARAIFDCTLPVVTGIGHEIDFTIADFVADHRAPTPSAAAEIVSLDQAQLNMHLQQTSRKIVRLMNILISDRRQNIYQLGKRLPHPVRTLQMISQRLDSLSTQLIHLVRASFSTHTRQLADLNLVLQHNNPVHALKMNLTHCQQLQQRLARSIKLVLKQSAGLLANAGRALETVGPTATLNRGYAIVQQQDGTIVRDATELDLEEIINTRFARGSVESKVKKINKDE